jgi:hypothetical protein
MFYFSAQVWWVVIARGVAQTFDKEFSVAVRFLGTWSESSLL